MFISLPPVLFWLVVVGLGIVIKVNFLALALNPKDQSSTLPLQTEAEMEMGQWVMGHCQ